MATRALIHFLGRICMHVRKKHQLQDPTRVDSWPWKSLGHMLYNIGVIVYTWEDFTVFV